MPEADGRIYAKAYAQPGAMRAGFEYFRNFERDAEDFARMGTTRLSMPTLVLTGEKAGGMFLVEQAKLVASDVRGQVVPGVDQGTSSPRRRPVQGACAAERSLLE